MLHGDNEGLRRAHERGEIGGDALEARFKRVPVAPTISMYTARDAAVIPVRGNLMDVFEAIAGRHSYRGPFKEDPVPREDLRRIVEAGLLAPSGMNRQTTTFVIVDDAALVAKIAAMHPSNQAVQQAKAIIACVVDADPSAVHEGLTFEVEDCAAAVENMLLAVTALGYATVWIDGWLRGEGRAETIGEMLGLPQGKVVRVILPVGVPKEKRTQPEKMPFEERTWLNGYGATAAGGN